MLQKNNLIKNLSNGVTAYLLVFSYAVCLAGSLQLNIWYALTTAVISVIISTSLKNQVLAPDTFFTVPLLLVLSSGTNALLPFCVIGGGLIYSAFNKKCEKITLHPAVKGALSLSLAFSVTALLTTHYFGIGAEGFTVIEILKTYRSLGFHPNWRGVFFGTVTLFAMITYPFKFKKANKYFPAEAFSLVLPLLLNLILNPDREYTPITEASNLVGFINESSISFFLPFFNDEFLFSHSAYISAFQSALALGILLLFFSPQKTRTDSQGTATVLNGISGGFPVRAYEIRGYSLISAVFAVLLIVYSCFFSDDILARIPLHSLAVVLIVSAWKQVPFKALGNAFKSGVLSIISLLLIFAVSIFTNIFITLLVAIIFNSLLALLEKCKGGAKNG
ncbi:MAG: hypothetical protein E7557_03310 [Ruminococcaceae bacterium]|nr:hypothetical protein [Oscillospiraceae bacterium]